MTAEDLTKLTDSNWVAGVLEQIALEEELNGYNPLGTRDGEIGRGEEEEHGKGEWEGKGRRLEVLRVPWQ
jgi:hypothetical protein